MVEFEKLAVELHRRTAWQATPDPLGEGDYHAMIEAALRHLLVTTGRAQHFDEAKLERKDTLPLRYDMDLQIDEEEYLLVTAEIGFFRLVQTNVNNVFGYSTDALTITNADKPYSNLATTIGELERKQRMLYYKMVRFNLL